MNSLRNSVKLIGHLGADPEIKKLENGKTVANFSVATNDVYKNTKGDKITETQWHRIVAWGGTAEFAEKYLRKGTHIALNGKLTHSSFEDKEGVKRYKTEVIANEFVLLTKPDLPF